MLFKEAVLRIHRIHMLLGLLDPDPLVRGMDPDPDPALDPDPVPSIIMQKNKKNLDSYYFATLFDFLSLKNDVCVASKSIRIRIHPKMSWIRNTAKKKIILIVLMPGLQYVRFTKRQVYKTSGLQNVRFKNSGFKTSSF